MAGEQRVQLDGRLRLQPLQRVHLQLQCVQLGHDPPLLGEGRDGNFCGAKSSQADVVLTGSCASKIHQNSGNPQMLHHALSIISGKAEGSGTGLALAP